MRHTLPAVLVVSVIAITSSAGAQTPAAPAPGTAGSAPSTTASRPTVGTVPEAGANSFTEAQARSRIEAAGFTDVSALRKDEQGVWRGRAVRNGTAEEVGLDFRGTVVTGAVPAPAR